MSLVIDPISHRVVDVTSVGDAKQEVGSGALATVTALLLSLSLYSCFVPVSIQTPIGFLSAVDICVALLFPVALFTGSRARSVTSVRLKPLFAAALTFLYLAVAQVLFSNKADATAISKFFIFLVFIPLTFAIGGINARTIVSRVDVPANISRAGGIIAVLLFVQIARGQTHGSEAVLYVDLFGVQVSKNGMGQMMVISTISAAWKWLVDGRKSYLVLWLLQIMLVTYLGARASTFTAVAFTLLVYFRCGQGKMRMLKALAIIAAGAVVLAALLSVGLFEDRVTHLSNAFSTNTQQLTSSTSRLLLWKFALGKIAQSPLTGWGFGTFRYIGAGWLNGMYEPHDSILQITYACGLIGVAAFLTVLALGWSARHSGPIGRFARFACLGYLANTLVDIIWTRGDGHLFWILFFLNALSGAPRSLSPRLPISLAALETRKLSSPPSLPFGTALPVK